MTCTWVAGDPGTSSDHWFKITVIIKYGIVLYTTNLNKVGWQPVLPFIPRPPQVQHVTFTNSTTRPPPSGGTSTNAYAMCCFCICVATAKMFRVPARFLKSNLQTFPGHLRTLSLTFTIYFNMRGLCGVLHGLLRTVGAKSMQQCAQIETSSISVRTAVCRITWCHSQCEPGNTFRAFDYSEW